MWYKTQAGLVNIEGTTQYLAWRGHSKERVRTVWLSAYQSPAAEPKKTWSFFRKRTHNRGQYIALAGFYDDDLADRLLAECMRRIEAAVRNDENLCDLSDIGERSLWETSNRVKVVKWNSR